MARGNGHANGKENPDPRWQFFPGKKRMVVLESWSPKKNTEDEKRVLLKFKMPITGQSIQGFPEFLREGLNAVEKERTGGGTYASQTQLEQMALEYFDTETSDGVIQRGSGITLQGFELSREKDGESYVAVLRFHYNVPWWKGIWKFLDTYWGKTLWCDYVPSPDYVPQQDEEGNKQMRIGESGKDDDMPHQDPERAAAVAN